MWVLEIHVCILSLAFFLCYRPLSIFHLIGVKGNTLGVYEFVCVSVFLRTLRVSLKMLQFFDSVIFFDFEGRKFLFSLYNI